jgi:hypothetical protein
MMLPAVVVIEAGTDWPSLAADPDLRARLGARRLLAPARVLAGASPRRGRRLCGLRATLTTTGSALRSLWCPRRQRAPCH